MKPASNSSRKRAAEERRRELPASIRYRALDKVLKNRPQEKDIPLVQRRTLRAISLTVALLWEVAGQTKNAHLLPPLSKVLSTWIELLVSGQLFQALLVSFQALFLGFLLSVGLGVPLGLLMGRYRKLESFLDIYMTALLAVPMISFIPFLVIAFGLGLHSRVWIVFSSPSSSSR